MKVIIEDHRKYHRSIQHLRHLTEHMVTMSQSCTVSKIRRLARVENREFSTLASMCITFICMSLLTMWHVNGATRPLSR